MYFKSLTLKSKNLEKQKHFYTEVLGFPLASSNAQEFVVQAGRSELRMRQSSEAAHYHFAFNVPYTQISEAYEWLKARVNILQDDGVEVIDFKSWKAKAIYFFDEDHNIVEFIGRSTLPSKAVSTFSAASIMEISEIGMPVANVQAFQSQIKRVFELAVYVNGSEIFCPVGSEEGLFIIVDQAEKKWYPTSIPAKPSEWKLLGVQDGKEHRLHFCPDGGHFQNSFHLKV